MLAALFPGSRAALGQVDLKLPVLGIVLGVYRHGLSWIGHHCVGLAPITMTDVETGVAVAPSETVSEMSATD